MPPATAQTISKKRKSTNSSDNAKQPYTMTASSSNIPGATTVYAHGFNGASQTRILHPHPHDVLSGRGGSINSHAGNVQFRDWVKVRKNAYNLATNKDDKAAVARQVIQLVEQQDPPGRFLHKDPTSSGSGWWFELDDDKIMSKTAQALREGAPEIRNAFNRSELNVHRKKRSSAGGQTKNQKKTTANDEAPMMTTWPNLHAEQEAAIATPESALMEQPLLIPSSEHALPQLRHGTDAFAQYEPPTKRVRMDYNGSIVRPNEESPPLLPSRNNAESMLLPSLTLPPPAQGSVTKGLPRSHSLALSDISAGDAWMNDEFVNPFESESDELASSHIGLETESGGDNSTNKSDNEKRESGSKDEKKDDSKLQRYSSVSSNSLSSIPCKPAPLLIGSSNAEKSMESSNGDMGGIGALVRPIESDKAGDGGNDDEIIERGEANMFVESEKHDGDDQAQLNHNVSDSDKNDKDSESDQAHPHPKNGEDDGDKKKDETRSETPVLQNDGVHEDCSTNEQATDLCKTPSGQTVNAKAVHDHDDEEKLSPPHMADDNSGSRIALPKAGLLRSHSSNSNNSRLGLDGRQ